MYCTFSFSPDDGLGLNRKLAIGGYPKLSLDFCFSLYYIKFYRFVFLVRVISIVLYFNSYMYFRSVFSRVALVYSCKQLVCVCALFSLFRFCYIYIYNIWNYKIRKTWVLLRTVLCLLQKK